ncbi:MAG: CPBP family intramembrane metalloprotease [Candidatus Didemnitutus sp.]|nr:CPBP family intramembrane metalloprotease [Candidatus Didemnitutus sp.]
MAFALNQEFVIIVEAAIGALFLARVLGMPEIRTRTFDRNRLGHWEISGFEVILLVLLIFLIGTIGQGIAQQFLGAWIKASPEKEARQLAVYGIALHGSGLLAWPLFWLGRRFLHNDYGAPPPPTALVRREPLTKVVVHGVSAFAIIMPVIVLCSAAWTFILQALGMPSDPQDLIAIFTRTQSKPLLVTMMFVACALVPINEELLFRGAIFRFCRQRFGRAAALLVSGVLFGALHGNWAGFLPLTVLGVGLAIAYQRTGDIRVSMIAHGLFNLNTLVIVLSGLPQT